MNKLTSTKLLTWLVIILLVVNAISLTFLWMGRPSNRPPGAAGGKDFLIKELQMDAAQQMKFRQLASEHREKAELLRSKIRQAKEAMFDLIKQSAIPDSSKLHAVKKVSIYTEELDLLTLHHFEEVRAMCSPEQQKKFDDLLRQITAMMGNPGPPGGEGGNRPPGPPPNRRE